MLVLEKKGLNFNKTGKTEARGVGFLLVVRSTKRIDFLVTSAMMSPKIKRLVWQCIQNTFKERSAGRLLAGTRCEVMKNWKKIVELGLQNGICSSITKLAHSENWKRFLNVFTPHFEITCRDGHLKTFETE